MKKMIRMPYDQEHVPHIVIEVNQKCNITCKACYKDKFGMTKPLELIKEEIDLAASQRNLSVVTLAGGEPTLHPQLEEVIAYISSKGIMTQMLSNGYSLTREQLLKYKEVGLKEIFLHVDKHQVRDDFPADIKSEMDLNPLRDRIGSLIKDCGITASLEITLYRSALPELSDFMSYILNSSIFTRLLVTCCHDFDDVAKRFAGGKVLDTEFTRENLPENPNSDSADLKAELFDPNVEVVDRLQNDLGMVPFSYVSSSEDLSCKRWVFYYSFSMISKSGKVSLLHLNTRFNRLVNFSNNSARRKRAPLSFGRILGTSGALLLCLLYGVTSFHLPTFIRTMGFLAKWLIPGNSIHHKSFTYQLSGPTVLSDGRLEYCKDCPDATVRDGKLVPVCMADLLIPIR